MRTFENLSEADQDAMRRQAAEHLTRMANGMVTVFGPEEARTLLMATALATAEGAMTRDQRVAWLREMADELEAVALGQAFADAHLVGDRGLGLLVGRVSGVDCCFHADLRLRFFLASAFLRSRALRWRRALSRSCAAFMWAAEQ